MSVLGRLQKLAKALTLPVPYPALGRSCVLDLDVRGSVRTQASYQILDQKPKVPLISVTLSPVNPGSARPLWTLIILLPKGAGSAWAIAPVD